MTADGSPVIDFRPLQRRDLALLRRWLTAPHVAAWWGTPPADDAATAAKYGPLIDGNDPTEMFVVSVDRRAAGVIQRYRIDDEPEWRDALAVAVDASAMAGIDYLIGEPDLVGRGIGPAMISAFLASTFERYPRCRAVVVDVDPRNRASWRALEKAGFRRIYDGDLFDPEEGLTQRTLVHRIDREDVVSASRPSSTAGT
jgi:aminoglycoside 6'-N-acetyltransferase